MPQIKTKRRRCAVKLAIILTAGTQLAACTNAEWHSINRQFSPTMGDSRLIDAKQRAIIAVRRPEFDASGNLQTGTSLAVCAEPSPDVFQATASSLAGDVSSEQLEAVLKLALSSAENATSIGLRTQTIQLLRDSYYRLCEAYLSDGIDSIAYDVLQRRFQNQITALLAIEQLTGAVVAAQGIGQSNASADAGANAALLQRQLETAREEQSEIENEVESAKVEQAQLIAQRDTLTAELPEIDKAITSEETKLNADGATIEQKAAATARIAALNASKIAKTTDLDITNANLAAVNATLEVKGTTLTEKAELVASLTAAFQEAAKQTITSTASATGRLQGGRGGGTPVPVDTVASAVRAITLNATNQDYETQVCFEAMRSRNHASRVKNKAIASGRGKITNSPKENVYESAFEKYCHDLFVAETSGRGARAEAITARSSHIDSLVAGVSNGTLEASDAAELIFALNVATPLDGTTNYLQKPLSSGEFRSESARSTNDPEVDRAQGRAAEATVEGASNASKGPTVGVPPAGELYYRPPVYSP